MHARACYTCPLTFALAQHAPRQQRCTTVQGPREGRRAGKTQAGAHNGSKAPEAATDTRRVREPARAHGEEGEAPRLVRGEADRTKGGRNREGKGRAGGEQAAASRAHRGAVAGAAAQPGESQRGQASTAPRAHGARDGQRAGGTSQGAHAAAAARRQHAAAPGQVAGAKGAQGDTAHG